VSVGGLLVGGAGAALRHELLRGHEGVQGSGRQHPHVPPPPRTCTALRSPATDSTCPPLTRYYPFTRFPPLTSHPSPLPAAQFSRIEVGLGPIASGRAFGVPWGFPWGCGGRASSLLCLKELLRVESEWVPARDGFSVYLRPAMMATTPSLGVGPPSHALLWCLLSPRAPASPQGSPPSPWPSTPATCAPSPGAWATARSRELRAHHPAPGAGRHPGLLTGTAPTLAPGVCSGCALGAPKLLPLPRSSPCPRRHPLPLPSSPCHRRVLHAAPATCLPFLGRCCTSSRAHQGHPLSPRRQRAMGRRRRRTDWLGNPGP